MWFYSSEFVICLPRDERKKAGGIYSHTLIAIRILFTHYLHYFRFISYLTITQETGGWIKTNWLDHPARKFRNKGLKISLSSDDPAVFNTSLTWQWRIGLKKLGWNFDDVFEILDDTIDASFAPEDQKEKIRREVQKFKAAPEQLLQQDPNFNDRVQYNDEIVSTDN